MCLFLSLQILDGKTLSEEILEDLKVKISGLSRKPRLEIILVGDNFASKTYVDLKKKKSNEVGILCNVTRFSKEASLALIKEKISLLNSEKEVDGIIVQLPLPERLKEYEVEILNSIDPMKDVDGLTSFNLGLIFQGRVNFAPATSLGIVKLLERYKIDVCGKDICIIGASSLVGIPLFGLLKNLGATCTVCHIKTKDIQKFSKSAEILVSATGKPKLINQDFVKKGAIVIDVGFGKDSNGKVSGDVDFDSVSKKASFITPTPGGVGPMTVSMLLSNVFFSYLKSKNGAKFGVSK